MQAKVKGLTRLSYEKLAQMLTKSAGVAVKVSGSVELVNDTWLVIKSDENPDRNYSDNGFELVSPLTGSTQGAYEILAKLNKLARTENESVSNVPESLKGLKKKVFSKLGLANSEQVKAWASAKGLKLDLRKKSDWAFLLLVA